MITVVVLAATGLALGTRAVTAAFLGPGDTPVGVDEGADEGAVGAGTTTTTSTTQTQEQATSTTPSTTTTLLASSTTQAPSDSPAGAGLTIGEPTITPRQPVVFRDRLTVLPGVAMNFPSTPTRAPAEDASGPDTGLAGRPDVTNGEAAPPPRAFNIGVLVEPEGHFAVIRVGIDAGPEGLADLVVDFGDGETLDVSQERIDQVGDIGTIEITHRYEPTLTPQPQEVTATATDGSGTVKAETARFETQATFLLEYSPITVTAFDDCDFFGKGDFELRWNNDGQDRSSQFDLGKGESHVEEEFRVGIDDVRYDQPVPLRARLFENDPTAINVLRIGFGQYGDAFHAEELELFVEVLRVGTHTVPMNIQQEIKDNCEMGLDFNVTLAMSDRPPG